MKKFISSVENKKFYEMTKVSGRFDTSLSADVSIYHNDVSFKNHFEYIKEKEVNSTSCFLIAKYDLGSLSINNDDISLSDQMKKKINYIAEDYSLNDTEKAEELDKAFESYGFFIPLKINLGGQFIIDSKDIESATSTKVLDDLRREFAKLSDEYKTADFSYNTGKLRCETCNGTGSVSMDVQFLPDVEMTCPDCDGTRYNKDIEKTTYNGLSLADIMTLTVDEALEELFGLKKVTSKLQKLSDLGLGYLTLGEATPSLSGGEAQRLKLASEIGKSQKNSIFIFDEPTIGLHPLDVKVLIDVFDNLIDRGATVIVIEHDLDLIANADYIIDIGIDEDNNGGEILATGGLEDIINTPKSLTGKYLAEKNLS
jgi:excinuclease UvrABC ATPase subunit